MKEEKKIKTGFVALVGRPNVGKSTLMNHLIGQKIAIVSAKPQTTRGKIQTVYDDERGQIIFLDTPGIHKAQNKLGEYMDHVAEKTLDDVDVVVWLVEPTTYIGAGEQHIIEVLKATNKPKILVINKIDTLSDPAAIEKAEAEYRALMDFDEIVPVSASHAKNLDKLKTAIFKYLPEGPRYYDEDTVTDQTMRELAGELIREQALRKLSDEVPHGIAVIIDEMHQRDNGLWDIKATIICEREAHKGIIIGKGGSMLKRIGTGARIQIEKMTGDRVNLQLFVKVRKDWRDSDTFLKNYGFKDES
jgi:GTP-binding protein Era